MQIEALAEEQKCLAVSQALKFSGLERFSLKRRDSGREACHSECSAEARSDISHMLNTSIQFTAFQQLNKLGALPGNKAR